MRHEESVRGFVRSLTRTFESGFMAEVKNACFVIAALLLSQACGASCPPPAAMPTSPREPPSAAIARYDAAMTAGDLEAVLGLFNEDAVVVPPRMDPIEGIAAIRAFLTPLLATMTYQHASRSMHSETAGELAVDSGITDATLTPRDGGDAISGSVDYQVVLRAEGNGWRISRMIWNNRAPQATPEPAPQEQERGEAEEDETAEEEEAED